MNLPHRGDNFKRTLMPLANLRVRAQNVPNMTVSVSEGGFWHYTSTGSVYVETIGGNSNEITAPDAPDKKWVLVVLNTVGEIVILEGTPASNPVLPVLPRGRICLAAIYIRDTTAVITDDMIFDMRAVIESSIKDHRDLLSNTLSNSHPAAAISFNPGASGLVSTNLFDVIFELKNLFDDAISRASSSGTSGTSGLNGTSGTSGENGTSGSSGTSGENVY